MERISKYIFWALQKRAAMLTALLAVVAACLAQTAAPDEFGLLAKRIDGPILGANRQPFTEALKAGAMGMRSHFANFGIELADADHPVQPTVLVSPPADGTLGAFLRDVFRQMPGYEYETVSEHMISVYPRGAKDDPNDLLNVKVPRFDVANAQAGPIMGFPDLFIPELHDKMFPVQPGRPQQITVYAGPVAVGPNVTLHLRNVTVREILNAVAVATEGDDPYGWIYRTTTQTGQRRPYWGVFPSNPPNWKDLVFPHGRPLKAH